MKLLFVLSQVEITGAEVYAVTLAHALQKLGHEVVFVSDKIQTPLPFKFYSLPLHSNNTHYWGRIKNVFSLKKIIKEEKIELVHSHSRAANLVSHFAKGSVPMIVTVHGRWRNHFAARSLPCLGSRTIAVCPYLERYLTEEIKHPAATISMIPNGMDMELFCPGTERNSVSEILFVGRFSGQKGNVARYLLKEVMPSVLNKYAATIFRIVSAGAPAADIETIEALNKSLNRKAVLLEEHRKDLPALYRESAIVVGSGRVAMEGMACGRPVVAIGESSAPGILREENFLRAFDSNFGDCGAWNLFLKENNLVQEILELLSNSGLRENLGSWGRKKAVDVFDVNKVANKIEKIYKNYV